VLCSSADAWRVFNACEPSFPPRVVRRNAGAKSVAVHVRPPFALAGRPHAYQSIRHGNEAKENVGVGLHSAGHAAREQRLDGHIHGRRRIPALGAVVARDWAAFQDWPRSMPSRPGRVEVEELEADGEVEVLSWPMVWRFAGHRAAIYMQGLLEISARESAEMAQAGE